MPWNCIILSGVVLLSLNACGTAPPYRHQLVDIVSSQACPADRTDGSLKCATGTRQIDCPSKEAHVIPACAHITPEVSSEKYELHFVEFDDQGWDYRVPPEKATKDAQGRTVQYSQTDHLMARLRQLLDERGPDGQKTDVNVMLYVHGWNHHAGTDDEDVKLFREILALQARLEENLVAQQPGKLPRKVVGIYVGWEGKHVNMSQLITWPTFWSRKAAALRVSRGAVLELFSRLQNFQEYYNGPEESPYCRSDKDFQSHTEQCRIRTLMVGHSFGAWILYSAVAGSLIETLNQDRDLSDRRKNKQDKRYLKKPADLIVLINPAFEAVRYEPLHEAAMAYRSTSIQSPLLVTISSSADFMTSGLFPLGRAVNTFFERSRSDEQAKATIHTHGHIDQYFTHRLSLADHNVCPEWTKLKPVNNSPQPTYVTTHAAEKTGSTAQGFSDTEKEKQSKAITDAIQKNAQIEAKLSGKFYQDWVSPSDGLLKQNWRRTFCGDIMLEQLGEPDGVPVHPEARSVYQEVDNENRDPNTLVWNITTDKHLMGGHSDIAGRELLEFIRQLYDDTVFRVPGKPSASAGKVPAPSLPATLRLPP